jgi:hypothetical protein
MCYHDYSLKELSVDCVADGSQWTVDWILTETP